MNNTYKGTIGENMACRYLLNKSYHILDRNWYFRHREIDIIARDGDCLVIVEVKTRHGHAAIHPVEAVTKRKQSLLVMAAEAYMISKGLDMNVRFDIISIIIEKNRTELEHLKDAFHPVAK